MPHQQRLSCEDLLPLHKMPRVQWSTVVGPAQLQTFMEVGVGCLRDWGGEMLVSRTSHYQHYRNFSQESVENLRVECWEPGE